MHELWKRSFEDQHHLYDESVPKKLSETFAVARQIAAYDKIIEEPDMDKSKVPSAPVKPGPKVGS